MKTKRFLSMALVALLASSSMLGCSQNQTGTSSAGAASEGGSTTASESGGTSEVSHDTEMTFEVYDVRANRSAGMARF